MSDDDRIEVHNPMDRTILVEVEGTEVAVKPNSTVRVRGSDDDG